MSAISAIGSGAAAPVAPPTPAAHGRGHGSAMQEDTLIISQDGMDALAAASGTVDLVDRKHHKHHHDLALLVYTNPHAGHGQASGAVAAVGTAGAAAPSGGTAK